MQRSSHVYPFFNHIRALPRPVYKKSTSYIKKHPLSSFFISIGLLFFVILVGNYVNRPIQTNTSKPPIKHVAIYKRNQKPMVTYQALIEKTGVIKIMSSQTAIVGSVQVKNGEKVTQGQPLFSLVNNYSGGNSAAISEQIANEQNQEFDNTYPLQLDAIQQQENIANINLNNFNMQQSIASQSAVQTTSLTNSNQSLLNSLNQQIQADQSNGTPASTITTLQAQVNELQQTQYTLQSSLSTLSNQLNTQGTQVNLANAQHYLTIEQLQTQESALNLNKNVMQLQAQLADIAFENMNPVSPVDGTIQRVYVNPGDTVTTSTVLAVVSANTHVTTAVVSVPQDIAQSASRIDQSLLTIGGNIYPIKPYFVTSEATDGDLYAMYYAIPDMASDVLTDGEYISISIPVGSSITGSINPYIPIDAVYQTPTDNYIMVIKNGRAISRNVTLGQIFGDYTEITSGLKPGDQVILDRTIVAGDRVSGN